MLTVLEREIQVLHFVSRELLALKIWSEWDCRRRGVTFRPFSSRAEDWSTTYSFKLADLVHHSLHWMVLSYLANLLDNLHSNSTTQNLTIHVHLNTNFEYRSFCSAGPRIWNTLSDSVKLSLSYASFRSNLKTHLFSTAFPTPLAP